MALFASLIIRLFQLVLLVGTMIFSHNKSAGIIFRLVFSAILYNLASPHDAELPFLNTDTEILQKLAFYTI